MTVVITFETEPGVRTEILFGGDYNAGWKVFNIFQDLVLKKYPRWKIVNQSQADLDKLIEQQKKLAAQIKELKRDIKREARER